MEANLPYAEDSARLRLLYRLPVDSDPERVLIVGDDRALLETAWPASIIVRSRTLESSPSAGRFDVIVLAGVLQPFVPMVDGLTVEQLLRRLTGSLVPGGVLIGHLPYGMSLRPGIVRRRLGQLLKLPGGAQRPCSAPQLIALLEAGGLERAQCFYVAPSIETPFDLIPSHPAAARAYFRRAIRAARGDHGRFGYLLRVALAEFGVSHLLRDTLLFWACRPC